MTTKLHTLMLAATAALSLSAGVALASESTGPANLDAGKKAAEPCQACHGVDGKATAAIYPNLAGQYADYLARALHEYRDGGRNNPIMAVYVEKLSDQDIINLAAYFSALPTQLDDLYGRMEVSKSDGH